MSLTKDQILHAWKDEGYRNNLSTEDRASLPDRPTSADGTELIDEQLEQAAGGVTPAVVASYAGGAAVSAGIVAAFD